MPTSISVVRAFGPLANKPEIVALMCKPSLITDRPRVYKLTPGEGDNATLRVLHKVDKRYFMRTYNVLVSSGILLIN